MTQANSELPAGYTSLNEEAIAEAKRHDEECRRIRERYERQKQLEAEEAELSRHQFCQRYGFDE